MASKILVDELAPQSHATDVTITTGKKIAGANTQFKITGGSSTNMLTTDGAGALSWSAQPVQGVAGAYTMRMEADFTGSGTTETVLGNSVAWGVDDTTGYASIGGSGSVASGVFTLGSTGIWLCSLYTSVTIGGTAPWELMKLQTSVNTGGSWDTRSQASILVHNAEYDSGTVSCIFDCENTTTHLFRVSRVADDNYNVVFKGSSTINYTYVNFVKLGET